jgi:hypothetical protein
VSDASSLSAFTASFILTSEHTTLSSVRDKVHGAPVSFLGSRGFKSRLSWPTISFVCLSTSMQTSATCLKPSFRIFPIYCYDVTSVWAMFRDRLNWIRQCRYFPIVLSHLLQNAVLFSSFVMFKKARQGNMNLRNDSVAVLQFSIESPTILAWHSNSITKQTKAEIQLITRYSNDWDKVIGRCLWILIPLTASEILLLPSSGSLYIPKTVAGGSSKTLVPIYQTTWCYTSDDRIIHSRIISFRITYTE